MSALGNGSGFFKFNDVLPQHKDTAVFNASDYSSNQVGGKRRRRKMKGGSTSTPIDFSDFKINGAVATGDNPTVNLALESGNLSPVIENSQDVVSNAATTPSVTNPAISVRGGGASRKKRKSKKMGVKKTTRKNNKRNTKSNRTNRK